MRSARYLFLFCLITLGQLEAQNRLPPINPAASAEAVSLLDLLHKIRKAGFTLTGQHNFPDSLSKFSNRISEITGAEAAVWGSDLSTLNGNTRPALVDEAIRQHKAGSVITLMWHAGRPGDRYQYDQDLDVKGRYYSGQWEDLLTPGTNEHGAWEEKVDNLAFYLRKLQQARVPILFRPYHEMNGNWFWWHSDPSSEHFVRLWKMLYQRLTVDHGLNNLIWVWNPHAPIPGDPEADDVAFAYEKYYPGDNYVDILATDVYNGKFTTRDYVDLLKLANGKLIALGEVGELPSAKLLAEQPQWSWIMAWSGTLDTANTPENIKKFYQNPQLMTRKGLHASGFGISGQQRKDN